MTRKTPEEKERIVNEWRSSGKKMKDWAPEHGIGVRTLKRYSWEYNKAHGLCKSSKKEDVPAVVELIPVKTVQEHLIVEIGACRISVNNQTDLNLLKKVAQVLGND